MNSQPIIIRAGNVSARISLHGGAILRLNYGDVPLLRPAPDDAAPIDSGCYPLVPFGNRVRDNRFQFQGQDFTLTPNTEWDPHYLHGEGWRDNWNVVEQDSNYLALEHRHDDGALPYSYRARQAFRLTEDGIELTMQVVNEGDTMPFGIGWHPYFPMTPGTTLQTGTGRMWSEAPGWLPGEPLPLPSEMDFSTPRPLPGHWVNNAFEDWSSPARIIWPERKLALTIDADPVFTTMFLFVSDPEFDPAYRRDFFALEPMSHLPDGHNLPDLGGLRVLEPGEVLSGSIRLHAVAL